MQGATKAMCAMAGLLTLLLTFGSLQTSKVVGTNDVAVGSSAVAAGAEPNYTIRAIRYATVPKFPLAGLVMGAPKDDLIDIAMVFWVIQGGGHTILFDSGFHREKWIADFHITDFLAPNEAVEQAGTPASSVTDIIVSHAHWDHMGALISFQTRRSGFRSRNTNTTPARRGSPAAIMVESILTTCWNYCAATCGGRCGL